MTTKDDEDKLLRSVALQTANSILIARQRAEQRSEFYLAEAQRLAHMGSWAFNPSGFFDYWSPELFQICGLDPAKGAPTLNEYLASVQPQDRELMIGALEKMLLEGSGCDVKQRILRPDGELRQVRWVGVPAFDKGTFKSFVGTALDVTEHEHLTQELRRRATYLAEAQRLTRAGSFAWNVSRREYVYWSAELYRVFRRDPADGLPSFQSVEDQVHPEDWPRMVDARERAMREKTDYECDIRLVFPDEGFKYVRVVGHPTVDDSGDVVELIGTAMDVTLAKRAEEALRQAQAELAHVTRVTTLGELAASIAHEVSQPIAGVVTNADAALRWLAAQPPDLEEIRQALDDIVNDGKRAGQILSRIRSLVKKAPPQKDLLDINQTILEVIALTRGEVQRNGVSLQTQFSSSLPLIPGDRIQLQQVVLNLILNAVEAMREVSTAQRQLLVSTETSDSNEVLVAVRDSGTGLDSESLDRLFQPFFTTKSGGMGMGLSICRGIVEAHGGRVWARPNVPKGATFQFTLPAQQESPS